MNIQCSVLTRYTRNTIQMNKEITEITEIKQTKFAYIDFDGVLASFTYHAAELLNIDMSGMSKCIIPNYYISNLKGSSNDDAIDNLMTDINFWKDMPAYDWAGDIINTVSNIYGNNWAFLTKGIGNSACFAGKSMWLEKHFPQHIKKLIITGSKKHNLCRCDSQLLIDDNRKNCKQWGDNLGTYLLWQELSPDWNEQAKIQIDNLQKVLKIHANE